MLRALLVDDEELSVRMLESIIDWGRCGVEIAGSARNGEDALRLFWELRPEIVLTDIKMPGMDGLELMRAVKKAAPAVEFVLVSAYADFEYAKEAIALGGANYLLKPVDEFELEKTLQKIVDKIGAQQVGQRLVENTRRQKDVFALYSYMRSGTGQAAAQKSAARLGLELGAYSLMGFMMNEASMNEYIENSLQLDAQLPYLQARLSARLARWCQPVLFDFCDAAWCALVLRAKAPLQACAQDMAAFFSQELHMEMHICFTEPAHGLGALPGAFRTLQQLHRYSFFIGEESVLGYGYNCEQGEFDQVALADAQKSLEAAIRQHNHSRAQQVLDEALEHLEHSGPSVLPFVYDFCYAGVRAVREALPRQAPAALQEALQKVTFQTIAQHTTLEDLRAFMAQALAGIGEAEETSHAYSQLVQDGLAYLHANFDRNLSLEEICSVLGVSRNYFCFLFKKETGQNLWGALTDIRLAKAKELLRTTQHKTYAIAYQVGYDNPSYFSKLFKKYTGLTPGEYRKAP